MFPNSVVNHYSDRLVFRNIYMVSQEVDMLKFDRIVIVVLALGVWVLVLTPREIVAHHKDDIVNHSCGIDGSAYGVVEDSKADIRDWSKVIVECTHY